MCTTSSRLVHLVFRLQIQQQLKMPATDAGETSGICNLRPWPTSPEDTIYIDAGSESLNQSGAILNTMTISAWSRSLVFMAQQLPISHSTQKKVKFHLLWCKVHQTVLLKRAKLLYKLMSQGIHCGHLIVTINMINAG